MLRPGSKARRIALACCTYAALAAVSVGAQAEPATEVYRSIADALIDQALSVTATDPEAAAALIERALRIDPDYGDAMVLAAQHVFTDQSETRTQLALFAQARRARLRRIDRSDIAFAHAELLIAIGASGEAVEILSGAIADELAQPRAAAMFAEDRSRAATATALVGSLAGRDRLHRLEHRLLTALVASPMDTAARIELGAAIGGLRARFPVDTALAEIDLTRGGAIDLAALEWLAGGAALSQHSALRVIEARGFPPGDAGAALFARYRELGGDDPLTMLRSGQVDPSEAIALAGADIQALRLIAALHDTDGVADMSLPLDTVPSPVVSDRDRDGRYDALLYHDGQRLTRIAFDDDEDGVHERTIAWGAQLRLVERDQQYVTVVDLLDGRLVTDVWRFQVSPTTDQRYRVTDTAVGARRWEPPVPVPLDLGEPFRQRYLAGGAAPELTHLLVAEDVVPFGVAARFDRQLEGADARNPATNERDEVWQWLGERGIVIQ